MKLSTSLGGIVDTRESLSITDAMICQKWLAAAYRDTDGCIDYYDEKL